MQRKLIKACSPNSLKYESGLFETTSSGVSIARSFAVTMADMKVDARWNLDKRGKVARRKCGVSPGGVNQAFSRRRTHQPVNAQEIKAPGTLGIKWWRQSRIGESHVFAPEAAS